MVRSSHWRASLSIISPMALEPPSRPPRTNGSMQGLGAPGLESEPFFPK